MTDITSPTTAAQGVSFRGGVHGGQQPIAGAHVYMLAASTSGYGSPSLSVLVPTSTGLSDSIGAYVLTASDGTFMVSGDYTCTPNSQVYLYALGGNPGAGTNSAAGLMAGLGNCPSNGSFATTVPFVMINEVSTVATAYALAGYAIDATHVASSGSSAAQTGLANAFLNIPNLENIATGQALSITPSQNGVVPQTTINTLANILASCINSSGPSSTQCTTLFANAKSGGLNGAAPTETATAAINIAHNPAASVSALYALSSANPPFAPALSSQPNDYMVGIRYSGNGMVGAGLDGAYSIAIDGQGNAWFTNPTNNSVAKLSSSGAPESPATGFRGGNQQIPTGIAIDLTGNAWVCDSFSNNLTEYMTNGTPMSPAGGYTGGGLASPQGVAIDGYGNIWVANFNNMDLSVFSSAGAPLRPAGATINSAGGVTGGGLNQSTGVAIDQRDDVWVSNEMPGTGNVSLFANNGTPISPSTGFMGGGINDPFNIAIDHSNDAWVPNYATNTLSEFSITGTPLSPASGFSGGGLNRPYWAAVDGGGNVWVANYGNSTVSEFTNAGVAMSPSTGYAVGFVTSPQSLEIDASGDVWVANYNVSNQTVNAVTELIGAGIPRVVPLSVAVRNNQLGARP